MQRLRPSPLHLRASLLALLLWTPFAVADVPLAPRVLDPKTPEEAWNVIRLATDNVTRLLEEERYDEVSDQVALCSPALRVLARSLPSLERRPQIDAQSLRAFQAVNIAAKGSMDRNPPSIIRAVADLRDALAELAKDYQPDVVKGEIYACLLHPNRLSRDSRATCETCRASLRARRIPYSFVYVKPTASTMTMKASLAGAPQAGTPVKGTARFQALDGAPVPESDLLLTHTRPVHLFVTDPLLNHCHFLAPEATAQAGEYAFTFTPASDGPHRLWGAVVPVETALEEHPVADLGEATDAADLPAAPESLSTEVNGLRFHLSIGAPRRTPLRSGITQPMRLTVTDTEGKPFQRLEPVMQAFAHVVGFYTDQSTMLHLHPQGADILDDSLRGGPSLGFRIHPPRPGRLRVFCLVQVDEQEMVVPFTLNVQE